MGFGGDSPVSLCVPLRPLQCLLMTAFLSAKICSCGQGAELFHVRLARGQQCGGDLAPPFGQHLAVRAADFAQQPACAPPPQLPRHRRRPPPFLFGTPDFGPELPPHIPVAQPVEGMLAAAHPGQQGRVFDTPRVERAMAAPAPHCGAADAGAGLAHRGFLRHAGQGLEIPPVGRRRDCRSPPQLAHAVLQRAPGLLPAGIALIGAIDFERLGFVDGGFDPQDAPLLVIPLDRVAVDGMFEVDAFGPLLEVADDFAGEQGRHPPAHTVPRHCPKRSFSARH